jgi:DNA-binding MarR family transcriptional regulator
MSDTAAVVASPARAGEAGLLARIVRLNVAVTRVLEDITGRAGVTFADYLVLGVVRGSPGHRSAPTAIAEVLDRTTGGMSLTLDRLESAGLVTRSRDPEDGRRVVVALTPAGLRLATAVNRALHDWEASLALPDGGADVARVLDDLAEAVRARDASSGRRRVVA